MSKKLHIKLLIGLASVIVLCIISGFILYSLSKIPFGILFQIAYYLFCLSLLSVMVLFVILCFHSTKRWLKWIGSIPTLLAVFIVILSLILTIDFRILYFKSLSPRPTKTEWIADLHFLAKQMAEKHGNLNALISQEKMVETVKEIEGNIPKMTESDIQMALFKLAALPNDCHTFPFIMMPAYNLHSFPFKVFVFPEGLHIVDAGREYKDLVGARILKIGSKRMEEIYQKLPLLLSVENLSSYNERFSYMVVMAEWLVHHHIIKDIDEAEFTFVKKNGEQLVKTIPSIKFYQHFLWSNYFPIDNDAPPVFTNYRQDYYRYKLLEDSITLYIQFNQCENQPDRETMDQFVARLETVVRIHDLKQCIVDVRNNDGGNRIWDQLIRFLREQDNFNRAGGLFALIGRRTFSSAVMFVTQLQLQTRVVLIGESTGQGPIFYGGPDIIDLPNSRLPFAISRRLTIAGLPFDSRKSIEPDIPIKYTILDFLNGRDPVLLTALTYQVSEKSYLSLSEQILKKYTGRYLLNQTQVMDIENKGDSLRVILSDFLPNSGLRFQSDLYPVSAKILETNIPGVIIEFPKISGENSDSLIFDWMGNKQILHRASLSYISAFEEISNGNIERGCETIFKQKELYLTQYPNLEALLNGLGYFYLRNNNITAALTIFRLNVDLFPTSSNVYDSYGEALMVNNQNDLAIQNYQKSLELNPKNKNAERVIKKLTHL